MDDDDATENDLLSLFKKSPEMGILLDLDVEKQWREQAIQGYGRIDFVFRLIGNRFVAIEIESHRCNVFTSVDEFSSPMNHAISQVDRWLIGAGKLPHIINTNYNALGVEQFSKLVEVGRRSQLSNSTREEAWNATQRKGVTLLTWDDVIDRGTSLLRKLKGVFPGWS